MRILFVFAFIFTLLLIGGCTSNEPRHVFSKCTALYSDAKWEKIKSSYPDELSAEIRKTCCGNSRLQAFYLTKFRPEDIRLIKYAVSSLNPHYDLGQTMDAVHEVLAYRHVIYNETEWHHMDKNIAIASRYRDMICLAAEKYDLPSSVILGVISWENSGDTSKISYAACGGLGQMSMGAVERAHQYSLTIAKNKKNAAAKLSGEEKKKLLAEADSFNTPLRHREAAKKNHIADERLLPECNIEDSAAFLKVLMNYFADRPDLAVSAYHNGTANNDDLLKVLMRQEGADLNVPVSKYIADNNITYLSLWQNQKTRDMLSGYLTMEGEVTNGHNIHDALGDESDIYPWKIFGAYSAILDSSEGLKRKINECTGRVDLIETDGLETFDSIEKVKKAVGDGKLVKMKHSSGKKKVDIYVTPELAGFIAMTYDKLKTKMPGKKVTIPSTGFLSAGYLAKQDKCPSHLRGISFDCRFLDSSTSSLNLKQILMHAYLNDRIYLRRDGFVWHVCLNPRFGREYYEYAVKVGIVKKMK